MRKIQDKQTDQIDGLPEAAQFVDAWAVPELSYDVNRRLRKQNVNEKLIELAKMDNIQFEHYIYRMFCLKGYDVKLTPVTEDGGADMIVDSGNRPIAVRCRLTDHALGIEDIDEALTSNQHYRVEGVMIITNDFFLPEAISYGKKKKVTLVDKNGLIDEFLKAKPI